MLKYHTAVLACKALCTLHSIKIKLTHTLSVAACQLEQDNTGGTRKGGYFAQKEDECQGRQPLAYYLQGKKLW